MLKICPMCRRTWSGGRDCPSCGEGHPLIDVAEPQGRKTFLRDKELAAAIRGYYGARTGMLIAFCGILIGLVAALFLWRKAVVVPEHHAAFLAAAIVCAVAPFLTALLLADRVVRRFSRGCIGRAPGPSDIRIARADETRKELLGFGQRG
jgi:MFS family permease